MLLCQALLTRMHIEPIRATTTEERQIDSQHFTVRKNDHDKAVALFAGILNYQKAHPEIYYYTRSRSFFREDPTNPDHEIWMFIDEYDNRAVYWQSLLDAAANDANGAANLAAWQALVVPPPPTGHIVWTEIQELRVQFRSASRSGRAAPTRRIPRKTYRRTPSRPHRLRTRRSMRGHSLSARQTTTRSCRHSGSPWISSRRIPRFSTTLAHACSSGTIRLIEPRDRDVLRRV